MCSLPSLYISAVSLGTPENSAIQKLSIIIIIMIIIIIFLMFHVLFFPKMKYIAHYKAVNRSENSLGSKPTTKTNNFWTKK